MDKYWLGISDGLRFVDSVETGAISQEQAYRIILTAQLGAADNFLQGSSARMYVCEQRCT